ncbi:MAG: ABC-2 family transporter protein [Verrucomicrobia bacterium]|nr:ABC-2 family transporter protein [Verrucomicrobiota bacterium]
MAKYLHVLSIGIQNTLVYRVNFLFRAVFGLVPLMGTLFVWQAIYAGKGPDAMVGAYTLQAMVSYYLVVTFVDALTAVAEDDWQIAADIKDGAISQFLLKPMDYLTYRLCLYLSGRTIYTAVALVPVALFAVYLREYFLLPADALTTVLFSLSLVLAALLQFFLAYTMALLAFWVLDVSTFIFIQFAFEYICSGHLFPLDILPPALSRALQCTPYPYLCYFPAAVYLGRVSGEALVQGLFIQAAWVAGAFALARWVWSRGIRRYSAAGG